MIWLDHPIVRWTVVAALGAGLVCAVVSLRARRASDGAGVPYLVDRDAEVGHIVMLAAMLVMVAVPAVDLSAWWTGLFLLLAAFQAVRLVQHARDVGAGSAGARERAGGAAYHLVASLAMLWSTATWDHGSHVHGDLGSSGGGTGPWWLRGLLILLFLGDATFTAVVLVTARVPGDRGREVPPGGRVDVVPHLVMDLAMVLML